MHGDWPFSIMLGFIAATVYELDHSKLRLTRTETIRVGISTYCSEYEMERR